jgi:hypothetical protein
MAFILKGVLELTRKMCFEFLWTSKGEKEGIPLVKLHSLEKYKDEGGQGLNNFHLFSKDLACKSLQMITSKQALWR